MKSLHRRGGYDLRSANRFMSARRRQQFWQKSRRQLRQELRALLPRIDWRAP